jgi:hypothetical protein
MLQRFPRCLLPPSPRPPPHLSELHVVHLEDDVEDVVVRGKARRHKVVRLRKLRLQRTKTLAAAQAQGIRVSGLV